MMKTASPRHTITGLFVFLLLGMFALFSTVMVLLGARVYRSTAERQTAHNAERLAPSYIRSMVRSADQQSLLSIESDGSGNDTLLISQVFDDELYLTRIYCHDGVLREWLAGSDMEFVPEDGEVVCPMASMRLSMSDPGMLTVLFTGSDGREYPVNIALYSR